MVSVALLLLTLVPFGQRSADGGADFRIGVAAGNPAQYCLALPGAALDIGSPVTVVIVSQRQRLHRLVTVRTITDCAAMTEQDTPGPYYQLASESGEELPTGLGVAVVGRPAARTVGGEVRVHLSERIHEARVRRCTSTEGVHLTVWSGVPLRSSRLWHAYWYLGYDVEPDCRPADYQS
jgi:hypothetical protein